MALPLRSISWQPLSPAASIVIPFTVVVKILGTFAIRIIILLVIGLSARVLIRPVMVICITPLVKRPSIYTTSSTPAIGLITLTATT